MRRLVDIAVLLVLFAGCSGEVSAPAVSTTSTVATTMTATTEAPTPSSTTTPTSTTTTTTTTTTSLSGWSPPTTEAPWQSALTCFSEPPPAYGRTHYVFDRNFYSHWCSASGIPVIGSSNVPLEALEAAAQVVNRVIGYDPVNTAETIASGGLVILYGVGETAADLPEWSYVEGQTERVSEDHPGFTASGGGITFAVVVWDDPVCLVPAEKHDAYGTADWGSVLVHELGHVVAGATTRTRFTGLMADQVTSAYQSALAGSAWHDRHYAMTSPTEYWAEATQVYFGQYASSGRGLRQPRTRIQLAEQDPLITSLLEAVYGGTTGLGRYWCEVYRGPSILLPEDSSGYAQVK